MEKIMSRVIVTTGGIGLVNRFNEHSEVATTSNYNSLTGLHTLKVTVTTTHKIKSSMSVFTRRCLAS
jgi:hypothetical protein